MTGIDGRHGPGDPAAAARLLWTPRSAPRRGPAPGVDLPTIVRAGVTLADTEGLAAVTMQRLAGTLGFTKMALYRYVPGKLELVALMTDMVFADPPRPAALADTWRPRLHLWSRELFDLFLAHPWTLETTVGARAMGPHELDWLEQVVGALGGAGLAGSEMLDVAVTLIGHVRTIATQTVAMGGAPGGDSPDRVITSMLRSLVEHRRDRFPALAAIVDAEPTSETDDRALDFGLACILDGVDSLISARRTSD